MKVVSFSIFKGGTGKTTSAVNTAAALTKKGKRVLVIDLDQQASATRYLDLDPEQSPSLYEVFMGTKRAALAVKKTRLKIDVLTSHLLMAAIEEALEPGDELRLAQLINPLKPTYDFILIDTPPGKAMLAFNGLAAADLIVIPAAAERMAVDVLQEEAGIPKEGRAAMPDSEVIYRWTDQKGGFSTPVILGSHSFLGGAAAILLEPSHPVARMPAMLSFFVRLTDYAPALRVDVPGVCVGREERIIDLGAALADWRGVEPVIAALGSDYGGARVYNPLLYAADQEVAIHRDRFQNLYLPLLRDEWGVSLDPTLSFARFM